MSTPKKFDWRNYARIEPNPDASDPLHAEQLPLVLDDLSHSESFREDLKAAYERLGEQIVFTMDEGVKSQALFWKDFDKKIIDPEKNAFININPIAVDTWQYGYEYGYEGANNKFADMPPHRVVAHEVFHKAYHPIERVGEMMRDTVANIARSHGLETAAGAIERLSSEEILSSYNVDTTFPASLPPLQDLQTQEFIEAFNRGRYERDFSIAMTEAIEQSAVVSTNGIMKEIGMPGPDRDFFVGAWRDHKGDEVLGFDHMPLLDEDFAKSAEHKTFPIRPSLNGSITSLEALINNTVGPDGVPEWDRLTGKKVINFTKQMAEEIFAYMSNVIAPFEESSENGGSITAYLYNNGPALKAAFEEVIGDECPEISQLSDERRFHILRRALMSRTGTSILDGFVVVTIPEISPAQRAARYMQISITEMPDIPPPGSDLLWHAKATLHELEHAAGHDFNDYIYDFSILPKDSSNNDSEWARNYNQYAEIDADYGAFHYLYDHIDPASKEYFIATRRVGAINWHVRFLDSEPLSSIFQYHTASALESFGTDISVREMRLFSEEDFADRKSMLGLINTIRKKLGVGPKDKIPEDSWPSVGKQAGIARWLIDEGKLEPGEVKAAEAFLDAVDTIGFEVEPYTPEAKVSAAPVVSPPAGPGV